MKFIENIDKERYEIFVKNHPLKSHFLQSYAWGEFEKKAKKRIPHHVGLINDKNKLVAATLLLEKKLPFGYSYFYAPRGFVIDFNDKQLLTEFTENLKIYVKNKKGIFLKIDPDIIWKKHDYLDNQIENTNNAKDIFNSLINLGYKHMGFTENFETMQPRYTFRVDMNNSLNEIENKFSKTTKQRINKAETLNVKVRVGDYEDITIFSHLMNLTENRKDFAAHELNYYQALYKIYNEENKFNIFIGSLDVEEIISKLEKEKEKITYSINEIKSLEQLSKSNKSKLNEFEKQLVTIDKQLEEYKQAYAKYGKNIDLSAHAVIEYNDKAWVIYAGNHNILTNSYTNYKTYYEHIKYCYYHKIKTYDQFGTIGNLSKDNPRLGLHEFKKKWGGDYIEFIGEFDLITNKLMYFIFTKLVPLYRNTIRYLAKRKNKHKS